MKILQEKMVLIWSLILISIVSMVVWRIEISVHSWEGLDWLGIPHYSVDFGLTVYALWCTTFAPIYTWRKRLVFFITQIFLSHEVYGLFRLALFGYFAIGPTALFWGIFSILFYPVIVIIPIIQFYMLRLFKVMLPMKALAYSSIAFLCAFPFGWIMVYLFSEYNSFIQIHSFKTGYIIPFFMLALGIQYLFKQSPNKQPSQLSLERQRASHG